MSIKPYLNFAALAAFFVLTFGLTHYKDKYKDAQNVISMQKTEIYGYKYAIESMSAARQKAEAMDKEYSDELQAALRDNNALRAANQRLRVKKVRPTGDYSGSSCVGDAAVTDSPDAGRDIFRLRASVISDDAKIRYMQEYIKEFCR